MELSIFVLFLRGCRRLVIINLVFLLLLIQLFLVPLDLRFEMILVLLMFGPERDSLVDLLLGEALAEKSCAVLLLGLLVHLLGQVGQPAHLSVLVHDLAAQHINLSLVLLVLRFSLIETQLLVLDRVFLRAQANLVQLILLHATAHKANTRKRVGD